MRHAGRWFALLGLGLAAVLFLHDGLGPIVQLLVGAGGGLVLAALFHALPMLINARAWQVLLMPTAGAGLATTLVATWVRESVNGLLPVARIGGEIAAYRLLVDAGAPRVRVAASIVVDMAVSLLSQGAFCLVGVALLVGHGSGSGSGLAVQAALAFVVMVVLGGVFVWLQRSGAFGRLVDAADRLLGGRWPGLLERSQRIDRTARALYRRRRRIVACFVWQVLGWGAGAGEIWLALYFLGHPATLIDALILESIVQAVSSVAFVVPGAIGVQEGGFLLVGAALGLDGPTSLALAAARRLRDLIVFFPGLAVWYVSESRRQAGAALEGGHIAG